MRFWGAAFDVAIITFLAFLIWQLAEIALTRSAGAEPGMSPRATQARAQTLLPLIRKSLLIVLVVMVVMITLSSIGVEIGPLLAGAGVVGLAIGFGAQTLVRDVVSGVFFLIDDAFRVGEYIEMDEIRGEVERISLRSLRLRHHRGHIFTIPFGELRYITNYNRDWVISKMAMRVPADTDPIKVKKIIKRVGQELLEDVELAPKFLQPLKSQGVYAIDDDSALIIRVKFMCKPRAQFVIRREAYHRIRKAFEEAGIEFARKKVEVSLPDAGEPSGSKPQAIADSSGAIAGAAASS